MNLFGVVGFAALLALIPTILYALVVWWLDRYEKEPLPLLAVAFIWGAVPAVLLALGLEIAVGASLRGAISGKEARDLLETGIIGPVIEESVKAIILVALFLIYKREFDDVLDGIVYGAMVGLGFALVENTLYLTSSAYDVEAGSPPDLGHMFSLWLLRAGLFGLNHSMFTAFTGAALGLARSLKTRWERGLLPALGLSTAIMFHAIHNSLVTAVGSFRSDQGSSLALGACFGIFVSDWGGIMVVLILAIASSIREGRIIGETLREEVAIGRFSSDEYETLQSGRKRWSARGAALSSGGFKRWRQLGCFFDLSTELAFRKHHTCSGNPKQQEANMRDVVRLRGDIDNLKAAILSRA